MSACGDPHQTPAYVCLLGKSGHQNKKPSFPVLTDAVDKVRDEAGNAQFALAD